MKSLTVFCLLVMMVGATLADDLRVLVRVAGTNSAITENWVQLEGWVVEPSTNAGFYVAKDIDASDLYVIGTESISEADTTLSKTKLRYVSRGDLGSWDFIKSDFTRDGTWRTLSLTNEVPAGVSQVYMRVNLQAGGAGLDSKFRKEGVTGAVNNHQPLTENGVNIFTAFTMNVSTNREIEYLFDTGTWDTIRIAVLGYYTAD